MSHFVLYHHSSYPVIVYSFVALWLSFLREGDLLEAYLFYSWTCYILLGGVKASVSLTSPRPKASRLRSLLHAVTDHKPKIAASPTAPLEGERRSRRIFMEFVCWVMCYSTLGSHVAWSMYLAMSRSTPPCSHTAHHKVTVCDTPGETVPYYSHTSLMV